MKKFTLSLLIMLVSFSTIVNAQEDEKNLSLKKKLQTKENSMLFGDGMFLTTQTLT